MSSLVSRLHASILDLTGCDDDDFAGLAAVVEEPGVLLAGEFESFEAQPVKSKKAIVMMQSLPAILCLLLVF